MDDRKLLRTGIIGTVIAAVCCFTPVLVVFLAALGPSAALAWLDYVLLPAFLLFIAVTVYTGARLVGKNQGDKSEGG